MNAQELTKEWLKFDQRLMNIEAKVDFLEQQVGKLDLFKRDGDVEFKMLHHEIDMLKRWRG